MQRKFGGIINVNFHATGQQLIMSSAFVKYVRKNENKMKQCISYVLTSRELMIRLGWGLVQYSYSILPVNLERLIKTCLNETYSRVRLGSICLTCFQLRTVSNKAMLYRHSFQLCGRHAIRMVQVNQDGLKLNGA